MTRCKSEFPAIPLCVVAFGLALMRGAANAGEVGPETSLPLFATGLTAVGYVAITLIMAFTLPFRGGDAAPAGRVARIAIRAVGSWIAAIGIIMGGLRAPILMRSLADRCKVEAAFVMFQSAKG